jgi:hypothetical protein
MGSCPRKNLCTRLTLQSVFVKTRLISSRRTGYLFLLVAIGAAAVATRFVGIGEPFTDTWSWRQSEVAAIARNYWQGGVHFVYPQIDWAGSSAGYVGSEFSILPFVAAICYKIAGVHEWSFSADCQHVGLPNFELRQ